MSHRKPNASLSAATGLALLALFTGCDNTSTSLLVEGIAAPSGDMGCMFMGGGSEIWVDTLFDTVEQDSFFLIARVRNTMTGDPTIIESTPEEVFVPPNWAQPVTLDFRWECESNGFTPGLESLVLPQFSLDQPFCLNEREELSNFVGRDAVGASGPAIAPGSSGLVGFEPIPAQLGVAFDEVIRLGSLANACCQELGGDCTRVETQFADLNALAMQNTSCGRLQQVFDSVGGRIAGERALRVNRLQDVLRFQPLAIYDGITSTRNPSFANLPLRIRGRFEFLTGSGRSVISNELLHSIGICRGCDAPTTPCTNF